MSLSREEVKKIAQLAKLELSSKKEELYQEQLTRILDYMEKLNELNTKDVEPLYSPCPNKSILREDKVEKYFSKQEILKNSPEPNEDFFVVPKII
ncbi:MAG: Asp-tRNA(Asn)/Glu-tRNA(Gln) amidotransferase subunit GatC [Desulfonauticus sp.]|nr:Asp-tRNA(Asn)/Glu-tRNA(Gln) amidotransferase subunit GatC [Desulfonauticus sp.]